MDEGQNPWNTAMIRGAQFSKATRCATLDVRVSESLAEPAWTEGTVDDMTLTRWFDEVCSQ
jgi:hypothetical protein